MGFLHVDGHTRVYYGTRNLPKAHIARLHMAAHASAETWIGDAEADPLFVITALPGASLAGALTRLIPQLRAVLGPRRKPTVIFDRGGWSPTVFKAMIDAGLHILTYRKAPFDPVDEQAFRTIGWTAPDGVAHRYRLAESSVELPLPGGDTLPLRQVTRLAEDGAQVPILTSNTRLAASAVCWRMTRRWRQENYFKYARAHFALDGLDSTPTRPTTRGGWCRTRRRRRPETRSNVPAPASRPRTQTWPAPWTTPPSGPDDPRQADAPSSTRPPPPGWPPH